MKKLDQLAIEEAPRRACTPEPHGALARLFERDRLALARAAAVLEANARIVNLINALTLNETVGGGGTVKDTASLTQQTASYGSGALPSVSIAGSYSTAAASTTAVVTASAGATLTADAWYLAQRTVAATTYDNLTLYGSLTDAEGNTLNFKTVQRVLLVHANPTGSNPIQVGPQNQTNAWGGAANTPWPGGVGATVYDEVYWKLDLVNPWGWTVDHATPADVLGIYNPNAGSVTYAVWILGTQ